MAKAEWMNDWKVGVRVWVERRGETVLGEGRAELLAAIAVERSITKGAKAAGMSYRRAWNLIQEVNAAAGEPLVEAAVGGRAGGGAQLTPRGKLALEVYDEVRRSLVESSARIMRQTLDVSRSASTTLHLAAAISLQEAIGQILAEFALEQPAIQVRAIYGASNELADHLLAGAPGDLFVSAESGELDRLDRAALVATGSRRLIAKNGLAAVGAPAMRSISKLADLNSSRVGRIAVAEPVCPLGNYSRKYLEAAGVYERLREKLLYVDNSRAVLAAVVSGAADVGIAFSSDASRPGGWQTLFRVPASKAAAIYEAALIGIRSPNASTATLLDFMTSPTANRCLRRCGLGVVSR